MLRDAELLGHPLLLRARERERDVALVGGATQHLRDLGRLAQVRRGRLIDGGPRDVAEQVGAVGRVGVRGVGVAQRDVHDVLGGDRLGPPGDLDRARQLEQRGQPDRIDGEHAVELPEPRLRSQAHEGLGDAGEVRGEVDVLERRLGQVEPVAAEVVGRCLDRRVGQRLDGRVPHAGALDFADAQLPVLGGDGAEAADEPTRGA